MDMTGHRPFTSAEPSAQGQAEAADALHPIGFVMDIAGSSSQITLDASILTKLMSHADPSIAMAGQVGSQIKIRIGNNWLLASIRTQRMHDRDHGVIMAQVDRPAKSPISAAGSRVTPSPEAKSMRCRART
jgi:hypothetical protein